MRRVLGPVLTVLAVLVAAVPAASAAVPVTARVVGGLPTTATAVPYQALVYPGGYLCGGSVLDATHVLTAAHCVYDPDAMALTPPASIQVYAGVTDRADPAAGQSATVTGVAIDPDYDPDRFTNDAAVLTLAPPGFNLLRSDIDAIPLTAIGYRPSLADDLVLSGWGTTAPREPSPDDNHDPLPPLLQKATLRASTLCASSYPDYNDAVQLCAGQTGLDACQGDSGGPLAVTIGGLPQLAGIVSAGAGCAWENYPGLYTRVSDAHVHDFIAAAVAGGGGYAVRRPANTAAPTISGTPAADHLLTCDPGTWTDARALSYRFVDGNGEVVGLRRMLPLTAEDAGSSIRCVVTAYGLTDRVEAASAPVTITGTVPRDGRQPAPVPPPTPAPDPRAPTTDLLAPTAKVVKLRCSRTMCILDVKVTDPAPSSGVAGIDASVSTSYRTTCRKAGRRRSCTKTVRRALSAVVPTSMTSFRVKTGRLRTGTQRFSVFARDIVGHRQAVATIVTKRTRVSAR
jgi:secreted trypsin-like serine protease